MSKSALRKSIASFFSFMFIISSAVSGQHTAKAQEVKLANKIFSQPEYVNAPISGVVSVMDGEAGIEDGRNVMYTTVKGVPPMFNVVDLDDYKVLRTIPLEGASAAESWNHAIAPNGDVYFTIGGELWTYSPVTKKADMVFTYSGENTFWCITFDEKGNVYIGTGPGGKVLKYDPVTKESRDYGRLIGAGQEYVRSIDYSKGYVYAGTSHEKIFKVNVESGEKVEIAAPLNEKKYCYDLNIVDDKFLIARFDTSQKRYFYDLEKGEWLDVVAEKSSSGLQIAKQSVDGKIYFPADKKIKTFDVNTHKIEDSGMEYETAFRGSNWLEVPDPDLPGKSLVTMNFTGKIVFFNSQTKTVKRYENVLPPSATITHKFENGLDGKIYVTGMLASKASAFDIKTNAIEQFSMGQAGSVVPFGNKVYFGVYPDGDIFEYDLSAPAVAPDPKDPSKPSNPKKLIRLENGQDRIGSAAVGDGKIYFGSISTYGELGGAVTVFNPSNPDVSSAYKVFRNIVQDQSVVSLAYKNGKLYGSTSINGGMAVDPKAEGAKLFVWDTVKQEKITELSLDIPGLVNPPAIGGLEFGPDGLLWGGANGYIFAMNPDTLKVVKYQNVNPSDNGKALRWGNYKLMWSEDGILYANINKKLYAIDTNTLESKVLCDTEGFTLAADGNIYYALAENRTKMYRINVSNSATAPAEKPEVPAPTDSNKVVTETVTGGQLPNTATPWYNMILAGAAFIIIGSLGWKIRRRYE